LAVLTTASGQSRATAAKDGGTLVVGLGFGEPDALDPTALRLFSGVEVFRTICERLYDTDAKDRVVPQLATTLPKVSKDGRTYTISLRSGVVFNDRTRFDAQSVVTSLRRAKTLPGSFRVSDFAPVDRVTAVGPHKVVIHLRKPYFPMLRVLSEAGGMIMSRAQLAKLGANFAQEPICVGPFMYDNRVAGDSITVVRSPYYYDKKKVHLDKIVFKVENDAAAAVAALKAGDLHALDLVSPTNLPSLRSTSSLRLLKRAQTGRQSITFNIGNKRGVGNLPYENVGTTLATSPSLRKAFDLAIDRKATGKVVLAGEMLADCTPVSPASPWFDKTIACPRHDPAEARRILRAANISNPTVHLLSANLTDDVRLAQAIQAQEAAVGINVIIEVTDAATRTARVGAGNYEASLGTWTTCSTPDPCMYQFLHTTGSRNTSGYSNPRLDAILDQARQALTVKAAKTLYHQAQTIVINERPVLVLYHAIKYAGVSNRVTGVNFYGDIMLRVKFAQFK
jgi:peptide/nickel transport system substrate-binding protein